MGVLSSFSEKHKVRWDEAPILTAGLASVLPFEGKCVMVLV